jgi:hypothetical protein
MVIDVHVKEASKVIGYFAYTPSGTVICDGDACIIAGSEEQIKSYLKRMPKGTEKEIIKKTRFGEIINGLNRGGAYAFDEQSYSRFYNLAKESGLSDLPTIAEFFSEFLPLEMHFIRIQIVE